MTVLVETDADVVQALSFAIGGDVVSVDTAPLALRRVEEDPAELLMVVGPDVDLQQALEGAATLQVERPHVGVILIRRRIDVVVLGQALRAGIREVVTPDDLRGLAEACRRSVGISRRLLGAGGTGGSDSRAEGRVITVFSAKGGCGKTTVATNLAATLAQGGRARVCLVDLDLAFGDVAIALQLVPARTIIDAVAMVGTMDQQGVQSLITPHSPGLDTVLAPLEPGEAEGIAVAVVTELVRVLRRMYDFVVIDTPPAFSEHVLAAFDLSDAYVLLATLDIPALKNLRLTLDMLDLLGYPRSSWLVVLNRSDSKVGLSISEVEQTLRVPIGVQIPSSRAVSASINRGVPLVLDEPGHPVSQAIGRVAQTVGPRRDSQQAEQIVMQATSPRRAFSLRRGGRS